MSRGTKSKAASGEKGSPPQNESGSGKMELADCFRMLNSRLGEQEKILNNRFNEQERRFDNRFEALQEDLRNTNSGAAATSGRRGYSRGEVR